MAVREREPQIPRRSRFWCGLVRVLAPVVHQVWFGLRICHRERLDSLWGRPFVSVCNHIHPLDCTAVNRVLCRQPVYYLSLEANYHLPIAGSLLRRLGVLPAPGASLGETRRFMEQASAVLDSGGILHIFPEGELRRYDPSLRPFRHGAFHLAARQGVPILPMVLRPRPGRRPRGRPRLTLEILPPIQPFSDLPTRKAAQAMEAECRRRMEQALEKGENK